MKTLRVSIVIGTRDRPQRLRTLLQSVASLASPPYEVVVVDQSTTDETANVVRQFESIGGLRHLRQRAAGLSRARNLGVAESRGDIVAFTDDDCRLATDFVAAVTEVFSRLTDVGVLFGAVDPGPHDPTAGLVPNCGRSDEIVVSAPVELRLIAGMGACMAARRATVERLGGFDVCLGAGARFAAAEETDLAFRALANGIPVAETPSVRVTHDGFRTWSEMAELSDGYLFGAGAMHAKHLRLWPVDAARLLVAVARRWAWGRPRINYLREPRRLQRLQAFARGWRQGMSAPLDSQRGLFEDTDASHGPTVAKR